jgi:hypothetical protein
MFKPGYKNSLILCEYFHYATYRKPTSLLGTNVIFYCLTEDHTINFDNYFFTVGIQNVAGGIIPCNEIEFSSFLIQHLKGLMKTEVALFISE